MTGQGLRFNEGKIRYDLIHPVGNKGLARVLTKGAIKYAERNWEQGMAWSKIIASAKRHLAAMEDGEDYDYDPNCEECRKGTPGGDINNWHCKVHTGELHADLLQCNAHFISTYYKIFPQGDNRRQRYLLRPKIGLDIDEVLCDWAGAWCEKFGHTFPNNWHFSYHTGNRFLDLKKDELNDFYLNLPRKINPEDFPFEPHCYITSRSVPTELTMEWLEKNGFPTVKVYSVGFGQSKVEVAKESGLDIFVDDRYDNFVELNNAGVCTFLWDAPHNRKYNVGYKRIHSLKDLVS